MARYIDIPGSGRLRVPPANPKRKQEPKKERSTLNLDLDEWASYFTFGGLAYQLAGGNTTMTGEKEEIGHDFDGLVQGAYKRNGIVFACELVRIMHFSEARFQFRRKRGGRPGDLFGTPALRPLEEPWPGGTTGDLLTRMLLDADFAGNAFVAVGKNRDKLLRLRPDWVDILIGSQENDPELSAHDPEAEVVAYVYTPGGRYSGREPILYDPDDVAHFAPIPDPEAMYRGMSWLNPVVTDILGDKAATTHKLRFFENSATPNLAIKLDITEPDEMQAWADIFAEKYEGAHNAYKTLLLGAGADYKVVGTNFQQLDFKQTVGVSETRIAAAAGVPPVIVGLSEGLQGSSLNAGNYGQSRRRFADGTMRPLWRNAAGSLAKLISVPSDAELWYDDRDIPFLQEDVKDKAEILRENANTVRTLTDGGYEPQSVIDAVLADDLSLLKHSGLMSVQLLPPGTEAKPDGAGDEASPDN